MKIEGVNKERVVLRCPKCGSTRLKQIKPFFSMPDYKCKRCKTIFKLIRANGNMINIMVYFEKD